MITIEKQLPLDQLESFCFENFIGMFVYSICPDVPTLIIDFLNNTSYLVFIQDSKKTGTIVKCIEDDFSKSIHYIVSETMLFSDFIKKSLLDLGDNLSKYNTKDIKLTSEQDEEFYISVCRIMSPLNESKSKTEEIPRGSYSSNRGESGSRFTQNNGNDPFNTKDSKDPFDP